MASTALISAFVILMCTGSNVILGAPGPWSLSARNASLVNCTTYEDRADIVILLDRSSSIGAPNFELMRDFVLDLLDYSSPDDDTHRIGIVSFSSRPEVSFKLNTYNTRSEIKDAVNSILYTKGRTFTGKALRVTRETMYIAANGDRQDVPNKVLIMTDGKSSRPRKTVTEAALLRSHLELLLGLVIGSTRANEEIKNIVTPPDTENSFFISNFNALNDVRSKLYAKLSLVVPSPCQSAPCQNGGTCTDDGQCTGYTCSCAPRFTGDDCETELTCTDISCPTNMVCNAEGKELICVCEHPNAVWKGNCTHKCHMKRNLGTCDKSIERWFFGQNVKKCKTFNYTGCNGNGNNFATKAECVDICSEFQRPAECSLAKDPGPCTNMTTRYFYNKALNLCKMFQYGGCDGNNNNFASKLECRHNCIKATPIPS